MYVWGNYLIAVRKHCQNCIFKKTIIKDFKGLQESSNISNIHVNILIRTTLSEQILQISCGETIC